MILYLLLILGLVILLAGGKALVDGASSIAVKLGLSPGIIGLTIVAFGTSAPELLVSISSALKGTSDIAVGNVVGSNIANLGLVLGLSGLIYPILIKKTHLRFDYPVMILVLIVFYAISYDLQISLTDGVFLTFGFILFNGYLLKDIGKVKVEQVNTHLEESDDIKEFSWIISISYFIAGIVALYFGSELLVENAILISREHQVSERVIGVTIVAIGTSLPELITSILAAFYKRTDLAIGNILGSNILNVLSILGITALIKPIAISQEFIQSDFLWMMGISLLLFPLIKSKMQISKIEGSILLLSYLTYMLFLL